MLAQDTVQTEPNLLVKHVQQRLVSTGGKQVAVGLHGSTALHARRRGLRHIHRSLRFRVKVARVLMHGHNVLNLLYQQLYPGTEPHCHVVIQVALKATLLSHSRIRKVRLAQETRVQTLKKHLHHELDRVANMHELEEHKQRSHMIRRLSTAASAVVLRWIIRADLLLRREEAGRHVLVIQRGIQLH